MQFDFSSLASKRLLDTQTYKLVFDSDPEVREDPRYAILSHRWSDREIEFYELTHVKDLDTRQDPRWAKIRAACSIAQRHGIRWLWSDTCCINTSLPAEKNQAINSMFNFYQDALICITYLADILHHAGDAVDVDTFRQVDQRDRYSEWFERGWTLQELLASRQMVFFDRNWTLIATKTGISNILSTITGIEESYLHDSPDFRCASVAAIFSWQANRRTTRPQDLVYSLLGILDVQMTIDYSESVTASFMRLQETLITRSDYADDESIFAWKSPAAGLPPVPGLHDDFEEDEWGMLAPSLECFRDAGNVTEGRQFTRRAPWGSYRLESWGLTFPLPPSSRSISKLGNIPSLRLSRIVSFFIWTILAAKLNLRLTSHLVLTLNCYGTNEAGERRPLEIVLRRKGEVTNDFVRQNCSVLRTASRELEKRQLRTSSLFEPKITVRQPKI